MKTYRLCAIVLALGVFLVLVTHRSAKAQNTQQPFVQQIVNAGTSSFQPAVMGSDALQNPEADPAVDLGDDGTGATVSASSGAVINRTIAQGAGQGSSGGNGKKAKSNPQLLLSFDGLNHRNQRLANHGNQFSLEPPDQGLCAGNGFVMEAINDVLNVYDTSGNPALPGIVDLNTFFAYVPAIIRPSTFGPEITDPSCYFDPDTQRWFVVVLTLDRVGTTSALAGPNHLDIAVSQTSSPLGLFNIYRLPVQDDGTQGTPNHGCAGGPCFGDYPHIGADANGFYITTNEFNFFAPGFRASQIYALSKQALASGAAAVPVFQFDTAGFLLDGLPGFTAWPATTPVSAYATDAGGTEYLLSSVAVFSSTSTATSIRIWGLSNTQSLNTASPTLALNSSDIAVNMYGVPPKADQKAGDFPLGQCFDNAACSTFLIGFADPFTETESNHVDVNDSRMQQVVFANGKLWGALDTAVTLTTTSGSQTKAGIAYFVIQPASTPTSASGSIIVQGALGLADNNLSYPAVGVTDSGRGVIAFTLLGAGGAINPGNFPTAAYASLDAHIGAGPIQIAAAGLGPEDGFTAYRIEVGRRGRNRWGDYGAAVADGNKTIWIASEYIAQTCTLAQYESAPFGSCGGTRTSLGNWGTRITKLGM
jgi:hypothetical protein